MAVRKLYRSNTNRIIGGVCGGFAEYLNLDPTIVRILWVLLIFFGGSGVLLYILSLIIIPLNPEDTTPAENTGKYKDNDYKSSSISFVIGTIFMTVGIFILLNNMGLIPFRIWHNGWEIIFAISLICFGVYLFLRDPSKQNNWSEINSMEQNEQEKQNNQNYSRNVLFKSITDRKLFGVCGGLAEHLNIDSTLVRIIWVIFTFVSAGLAIILYIVLALILPEKKIVNN